MRTANHDTLIALRVSDELRQAIRDTANDEGLTSSEFLRRLARARVRAGIPDRELADA